ncbi:hypothetical protein MJ579_10305 [Klebsiella pneumoniae]|nr:hypothetical protein MJ579_10305 [Klebsiella pneumoniae]
MRDGVRGKDKLDVPINKNDLELCGQLSDYQHSEINRTHEILQDDKKCEMIVVIDCHMTSWRNTPIYLSAAGLYRLCEMCDFALDALRNMSYVIFADQGHCRA